MQEIWTLLQIYLVLAVVTGAICGWLWYRLQPHQRRLLPLQRLRRTWWSGHEVFLAAILFYAVPGLLRDAMRFIGFFDKIYGFEQAWTPDDIGPDAFRLQSLRQSLWITPIALPMIVALVFMLLYLLSGTRPHKLGMTWARWRQNIVFGYLAWLLVTPAVFAVNGLTLFLEQQPHPIEQIAETDLMPIEWFLLAFQALAFAPITEELLFRGLIMGWLGRSPLLGHSILAVIILLIGSLPTYLAVENADSLLLGPALFVGLLVPIYWILAWLVHRRELEIFARLPILLHLPTRETSGETASEETDESARRKADPSQSQPTEEKKATVRTDLRMMHNTKARLAIFGSALLFAVVHPWPSMIPLFVLGLALGWVAHRTQSLVAPIAIHALFNAVSTIGLFVGD